MSLDSRARTWSDVWLPLLLRPPPRPMHPIGPRVDSIFHPHSTPTAGRGARAQAAHLVRRAGFGGSPDDVARLAPARANARGRRVRPLSRHLGAADRAAAAVDDRSPRRARSAPGMRGAQTGRRPTTPSCRRCASRSGKRTAPTSSRCRQWFLDRMIQSPAPAAREDGAVLARPLHQRLPEGRAGASRWSIRTTSSAPTRWATSAI